jgi:hypothetical protein
MSKYLVIGTSIHDSEIRVYLDEDEKPYKSLNEAATSALANGGFVVQIVEFEIKAKA